MAVGIPFIIEAHEVNKMVKELGLSVLQLLASLVDSAKKLARPPISQYHVGAVGLASDGRIIIGVNLEFPSLPLHHSIHAEQFLVTNANLHGISNIEYIAVSAAPCGHCRQFFQEIRNSSKIKILITSEDQELIFRPLSSFLPHPFGPADLLSNNAPFLLEFRKNNLILEDDNQDTKEIVDLKRAAFESANSSHAPYSGCPSGIALKDINGRIFVGSYIESTAYNPSLGPVQAAIVAYLVGGGGDYNNITAAVLVEKKGAMVEQDNTARLLLRSLSPNCKFRVFKCCSSKI